MAYCELPENELQPSSWVSQQKWKRDPDANAHGGFAPRNKHYINGEFVSQDRPGTRESSPVPFPRHRVPRRGFIAVPRDDPEYSRLCKEQGLEELLGDAGSPLLPNGVHSSPMGASATAAVNGPRAQILNTSTTSDGAANHQPISPSSESGPAQARPLVNGSQAAPNTGPETS